MKNMILLLFAFVLLASCDAQQSKINAVSFVAAGIEAAEEHVVAVKRINANYATVMPFGFIKDLETPEIMHNTDRQWFGETKAGIMQYARMLQKQNISVMVKPQIWIWRGEFTGYLKMDSEEKWKQLEDSYTAFILTYAEAAQEVNAEIFCIGTELEQFINHRPEYWSTLISEVKKVYKGKLTYAANWDEYKRVPFWKELDYIGVDAYFPISESKTPSVEEAKKGWQNWKKELFEVSTIHERPIVFTEYGYRSVDFAGKEPWKSDRSMPGINMEAQTNLTKALIEELYPESWFKGGFIWKWFIEHDKVGGAENNQFTPQNKPVEEELKRYFSLYSK
ncbi:hypothetical protein ULMA_03360 [Patiriisocius marinus]|uniref:Glycoside hydrolase n=2 Tax=Patiriisocius marinus TaxID=1397112 RepID=A0A5J4IXC4_9FLAO|nr:hypothetical protein ULMA_03360 [Patiriisocius marinus]